MHLGGKTTSPPSDTTRSGPRPEASAGLNILLVSKGLTCRGECQRPGGRGTCRDRRCLHSSVCSSSEEEMEAGKTQV